MAKTKTASGDPMTEETVLSPVEVEQIEASAKSEEPQLQTIEWHARELGHVDTYRQESPPEFIDVRAQKAFILAMVKAHKAWGIGKVTTREEYEAAVNEAFGLSVGEALPSKAKQTILADEADASKGN